VISLGSWAGQMGSILIISSRSEKALQELIASLPQENQVFAITADLSKTGEAKKLAIKAIQKLGHIDVPFNNAGIGYFSLMEEATEKNIRHLFKVNAFSPLFLIQTLLPQMKKRGGGLINIISSGFRVPIATVGVYSGSKSALSAMANTMRLELASSGIEIINIYPSTIDTAFEENAIHQDERPGFCPSDRCGLPRHDIARRVLKAASGPSGEVWLEREGKWYSAFSIIFHKLIDKRLLPLRDKVLGNKTEKKRRWRLLQVESSIACNLQYVMCPWKKISKESENRGIMSQEIWESIRPYLKEVTSVDFTEGGEPLLQPNLVNWVGEAKAAGCEAGFLTNGMLLKTETIHNLIQKGIDWICVSIDAATADLYEKIRKGANFNRVCENVAQIGKLRYGKIPKTMINFA
jgi:short-subunit dehydrogenase